MLRTYQTRRDPNNTSPKTSDSIFSQQSLVHLPCLPYPNFNLLAFPTSRKNVTRATELPNSVKLVVLLKLGLDI